MTERDFLPLDFYKGRLNTEDLLETLGIDIAFRLNQQIMCHCPDLQGNHKNGDANPSFGFHEEKLKFNCFVCGGGDLIDLVMMMLDTDEEGAEKFLIGISDLEPTDSVKFQKQIEKILNPMQELEPDPEYPLDALFPFQKIHPYLYERGLTKDVIIEHQIGFDESHCGIVIPHLFMGKLKGWQVRHLVCQNENGKDIYFCPECEPYHQPGKIPKYKNTSHFPKENTLYGYDQAMAFCKKEQIGEIVIVESPFTALYMKSNGIPNVMATFGAFSRAQSSLLFPFHTVYFWPDNDGAGRENTKRAIQELEQYVKLQIVPPVEGNKADAADVPGGMLREYLYQAIPSILWSANVV